MLPAQATTVPGNASGTNNRHHQQLSTKITAYPDDGNRSDPEDNNQMIAVKTHINQFTLAHTEVNN